MEEDADATASMEAMLPGDEEDYFTMKDMNYLTVPQLKQQLRLRGQKVSGNKSELMQRLFQATNRRDSTTATTTSTTTSATTSTTTNSNNISNSSNSNSAEAEDTTTTTTTATAILDVEFTKAVKFANERGKELINVTEYLDPKDRNKATRTLQDDTNNEVDMTSTNDGTETWGTEARIVEDYEGRSVVVDSLSRTIVEFKGSNQTYVSAFVVASRDALQGFLAGRARNTSTVEARLMEIQTKRELASRIPLRLEQEEGLDEGDEKGIYTNVMDRDYSDWGKYTQTGAQLSAQEVQGVLLLSDVYGAFDNDTQVLAEKIAFECQPIVVMVPDLFRGDPWEETSTGKNEKGQTYEQWRSQHDELRVSVDIRAAAACLRENYGVTSVVVWGTCFGGGRALEAAAGYFPNDIVHDWDGSVGPPAVDPSVCVAWYPTRYNSKSLFGKSRESTLTHDNRRNVAVIALFGELDEIDGATASDAASLKALLEEDTRVKDYMVKVFPNQGHGFAHIGLSHDSSEDKDPLEQFVDDEFGGAGRVALDTGDAEVACLLSTAFMETYSRVFLPTIGPTIGKRDEEDEWSSIIMKDMQEANNRNIREEIETALDTFEDQPHGGHDIDIYDEDQHDELKRILVSYLKEDARDRAKITDEDDLLTVYEKLIAADENFKIL